VAILAGVRSTATTVTAYLASLPADRRAGIEAVRKEVRRNLDRPYEECMLYGMIGYAVPHRVWPQGYHCDPAKPLMMAALASQKNGLSVYLMSVYGDAAERAWFQKAWAKTGKKLDMGGACVRFKTVEHAALDVIGEAIRRMPAKAFLERYLKTIASTGRRPDGKKGAAGTRKGPARQAAKKVAKKAARRGSKKAPSRGS
jgi:hypothetical protein